MNKDKKIQIIIDKKKIEAFEDQTILEVLKQNKIDVPALCFHSDLKIEPNCRLCLVEIKGKKGLHAACSTRIEPEIEITTDSQKIKEARKINLELIFAQHREECHDCIWRLNCELLRLAEKYGVQITRFMDRKTEYPVYQFGSSLIFDSSKCIDCRNCVDMCRKQGVDFLEMKEKGHLFQVFPSKEKEKDCIYCGQCIVHCPAGAFEAVGEFEDVEKPLQDKSKVVVFQFAPSIRTSLGERFNLPHGSIVTNKLVAAIRKLGANKVFDVSVGADITTVEEAKELIKRLEERKGLPMFTSCCPAWVKFIEFFYPEFIPNLTTVRSPHVILGGVIKTFWAQKENIDPKNIIVVSIMPCVAKKYEIKREELKIDGMRPVDHVLTTREIVHLLKKRKIDLVQISPEEPDCPLGFPSGAGVIYGASGGVMESALRTAYEKLTNKDLPKVEFKEARGMEEIKKAKIDINGTSVKAAIANGTGNAKELLKELQKNPKLYDYIEVMACPGGCVGGGGQPVPTNGKIREARAKSLYKIDTKKDVRKSHRNPLLKKVYQEFLDKEENVHLVCHTKYSSKTKEVET